jgi:hypothetical protein
MVSNFDPREAHSMAVSMYTISIPVFIQHLNGLNTVLDKAASWAAARKVNEADLLNMRLSPDMFNLARQVRAATDHAANAAGRLAGKELLKFANDETTIAQLRDRQSTSDAEAKTMAQRVARIASILSFSRSSTGATGRLLLAGRPILPGFSVAAHALRFRTSPCPW